MAFADDRDYAVCRQIMRQFGTTYYFATLRFPPRIRRRVYAVYGFVRVPDEWVDNPGNLTSGQRLELVDDWRNQLISGLAGTRPEHPAMRAFVDTVIECGIPLEEADLFLQAMKMDVTQTRYETYQDLERYMRGSAAAVGVMMCFAMDARADAETLGQAKALGDAMQMTNFLRDVSEDVDRGRIYLPLEDLRAHGVSEADILSRRFTPEFKRLMQYEVCRTKKLYYRSDMGLAKLPRTMRRAVLIARLAYAQILDRIEAQDHNVFLGRARTTKTQKLGWALRVALSEDRLLERMVRTPY